MKLKPWMQALLGLLLAAGGFYIFFKNMDPQALLAHLRRADPVALGMAALLSIASLWFRSLRWAILLPDPAGSHKRGLFSITSIGFMVNNILPARIGEAVRILLLWRKNNFSGAVSIGSIVLERLIDMYFFGFLFALSIVTLPAIAARTINLPPGLPVPPCSMRHLAYLLFAGCIAVLCGALFTALFPKPMRRIFDKLLLFAPQKIRQTVSRMAHEILSTIAWVKSWKKSLAVLLLSLATLSCFALSIFWIVGEFTLPGLSKAVFAQSFAAMGAAIPFTPGFVGTLHAVLVQGFLLLDMERATAMSVTILSHAVSYVAVTLVGLYFFFKDGLRLKDLTQKAIKPE